jgi:hypothetical protein
VGCKDRQGVSMCAGIARVWVRFRELKLRKACRLAGAQPFPVELRQLAAYFQRLMARPSVKRTIEGAEPNFAMFPFAEAIPSRFRKSAAEAD